MRLPGASYYRRVLSAAGRDTRAQSIEIAWGFAVLTGIGLIYAMAMMFYTEMKTEYDDVVVNKTAQQGLDYTGQFFDNFLIIAGIVVVIGVIALSVYQTRGV